MISSTTRIWRNPTQNIFLAVCLLATSVALFYASGSLEGAWSTALGIMGTVVLINVPIMLINSIGVLLKIDAHGIEYSEAYTSPLKILWKDVKGVSLSEGRIVISVSENTIREYRSKLRSSRTGAYKDRTITGLSKDTINISKSDIIGSIEAAYNKIKYRIDNDNHY